MDNEQKRKMLNGTVLALQKMLDDNYEGDLDPESFIRLFKQYNKQVTPEVDENEISLMLVRPLWDFLKDEMSPNSSYAFRGFEAMQDFVTDGHYYEMLDLITPNGEFTGTVIIHMSYLEEDE